jgi:hypothetical protein
MIVRGYAVRKIDHERGKRGQGVGGEMGDFHSSWALPKQAAGMM